MTGDRRSSDPPIAGEAPATAVRRTLRRRGTVGMKGNVPTRPSGRSGTGRNDLVANRAEELRLDDWSAGGTPRAEDRLGWLVLDSLHDATAVVDETGTIV